jgi:ArsR family transcriptional regulator, arsenate/arsenite/antimonite-responsive transcriptional repressor
MAAGHLDSRRLAQRFHALGDELRLDILGRLRGGERCVCELTDSLELAQSRLSFHLKVLKDAGLISHRREARWSYYALDADALREIEAHLTALLPAAGSCCRPPASDKAAPAARVRIAAPAARVKKEQR